MKRRILALLSVMTLLLVSCIDDSTPLNLKVKAENSTVKVGEKIKLTASTSLSNSEVTYYWKEGGDLYEKPYGQAGSSTFSTTKYSTGTYVFNVLVQTNDLTSEDFAACTVKVTTSGSSIGDDQPSDYPIHSGINATTFWAGEGAGDANHDISNVPSAWDSDWATSFGVEDWPGLERDADHIPTDSRFKGDEYPKVNPYYFALPYNDFSDLVYDGKYNVSGFANRKDEYKVSFIDYLGRDGVTTTKTGYYYGSTRKASVENIPWKNQHSSWAGESMVKGRWARIRYNGGAWVYAQWLDAGPYFYDDVEYVFGDGITKPLNQGSEYGVAPKAGIDLSPSVMLQLGVVDPENMSGWKLDTWLEWGTSIEDGSIEWQFVDDDDVPSGPWKRIVADNKTNWN